MTEFDKRICITLGTFGAVVAHVSLESSICVLAAAAIWILRSTWLSDS